MISTLTASFLVPLFVTTLGVSFAVDPQVRDLVHGHPSNVGNHLASAGQTLGNGVTLGAASLILLGGDELLRSAGSTRDRVGLEMAESLVLGTLGVMVGKGTFHRWRPYESPGNSFRFDQPSLKPDHVSFPSGHTAGIFAAVTSVALTTQNDWVAYIAFPCAALTGWSRIYHDKHWLSDTVAGAGLGIFSAWSVHRWNRPRDAQARATFEWEVLPLPPAASQLGATMLGSF